ncbi:unnamed protein product [Tuber aestivum]|uniref:Uncharacterized protein n=1 Tax=Tuber aestivum TaxID=59557 RepID=A0A292PQ37_9PEZI|nr:unnamed protein product [Tuber aestivum]
MGGEGELTNTGTVARGDDGGSATLTCPDTGGGAQHADCTHGTACTRTRTTAGYNVPHRNTSPHTPSHGKRDFHSIGTLPVFHLSLPLSHPSPLPFHKAPQNQHLPSRANLQ